jgi:hypothetical protein
MTTVSPWDNPEANPDELAALLDAGEPGPAPAWPWCSVAGCDHSRTIPAGEPPEHRARLAAGAWVGPTGVAICECHEWPAGVPVEKLPGMDFPCDAGQAWRNARAVELVAERDAQGAPNGS